MTAHRRRSRLLPSRRLLLIGVLSFFAPTAALADLHVGVALIRPGDSWDFSDSTAVAPPNGDLRWITVVAGTRSDSSRDAGAFPYFFVADYPAQIAIASWDSTYEELTSTPSDPAVYSQGAEIFESAVYVVRTKENHFAKLIVKLLGGGMTIEYTYQDSGSRILVNPVATRPATWGNIKNLYRRRRPRHTRAAISSRPQQRPKPIHRLR